MYQLIKNILFSFDAEKAHYFSMNFLRLCCRISLIKKLITHLFRAEKSAGVEVMGLHFKNKVGLGAGFDKNAMYLSELEALGFGFVEIGTVTPLPQEGNDKPRLFRLKKDHALINRMGFNNEGADVISQRLFAWRKKNPKSRLIIGGNIGKNKLTPNTSAWTDYVTCFKKLFDYVDYFVVNVSSPNTPGLRELQEKESLQLIFTQLQTENQNHQQPKPILLKIAPDLSLAQIDEIIALKNKVKIDGLIVSNTTLDRSELITDTSTIEKVGAGGLSGKPVAQKSSAIIQYISDKTNRQLLIIGSGGIFNGKDAAEKIEAGSTLVQVWTGFIYEGPTIVKNIDQQLSHNTQ